MGKIKTYMQGPVLIASSEGGVNIEDVAAKNPDAIIKVPIDINNGFAIDAAKDAAKKYKLCLIGDPNSLIFLTLFFFRIGIPDARTDEVAEILINLYALFQSKDATMVEINPFAEDSSGNFFCLDAKLRSLAI